MKNEGSRHRRMLPHQQKEVNGSTREELTHNLTQSRLLAFCTALQVLNVID